MDREFMRAYYRAMYPEDLPLERVNECEKYVKAKAEFQEAEDAFIKLLGGVGSPLVKTYEEMCGSYAWMHSYLFEEIYLVGAEDREKMLR